MDEEEEFDMSAFEVDEDDDDDAQEGEDIASADDEEDTAALFDVPDSEEDPEQEEEPELEPQFEFETDSMEELPKKVNFFAALLQKLPPLPKFLNFKEKLPALPKLKRKDNSLGKTKMSPLIKGLVIVAVLLFVILAVLLVLVINASRKQAAEEEIQKQAERDRLTALGHELDYALANDLDIFDDSPTEDLPVEKPPTNVTIDVALTESYESKLERITERLERIIDDPSAPVAAPQTSVGDVYLSVLEDTDNPSRVDVSGNIDPSQIEHTAPPTDSQQTEMDIDAHFLGMTDGKAHVANHVSILDNNYEASRDAHAKLLEALELYRAKDVGEREFALYCEKAISFQYRLLYAVEYDGNRNSQDYVSACLSYITAAKNTASKIADYILMQDEIYTQTIDEHIAQTAQAAAQVADVRTRYLRSEGFNDLEAAMIEE